MFISQEKMDTLEHELRREVEDLKLRLQMAADHYKEKFKECQRLQKQINKLSDQSVSVAEFILSEVFLLCVFLFAYQIYSILDIILFNIIYLCLVSSHWSNTVKVVFLILEFLFVGEPTKEARARAGRKESPLFFTIFF